jgi:Sigma-70 region 2
VPPDVREDLAQEWTAELHEILRGAEALPITRLYRGIRYAFGLLWAAPSIGGDLSTSTTMRPKLPTTGPKPAGHTSEGKIIGDAFGSVLRAAAGGDKQAFAAIWRSLHPGLLRYLRVMAPGAAEDLASETWLDVVRGLAHFEGTEASFRGWVFTLARHPVTDWRRRTAR